MERVYRGLKATYPDVRPFLMPRSGTAGMQRYSTFPWTGDIRRSWGGLKAQIPALISSGMSGVAYMGSDVGGFAADGTDSNLYLRWIEFSVFSPMMRTHSTLEPEPYNSCYSGILPSIQRYITLRYSYLPYLYTLAYENATHGTPLARPVNFYDATSWQTNCLDAYLWGKDLFVAPVVEDATSRSITFPAGTWIDMNDQKTEYSGLTTVSYDAPLETLPYFARKGAFIPRFSQTSFANTRDIDHSQLTVAYFMDDSNPMVTGRIFDDDKTSTTLSDNIWMINLSGYRGGNTDIIGYTTEGNGYEGMPAQKTLTFEIPNYRQKVKNVALHSSDGDCDLSVCASKAAFEACTTGYYMDSDNVLHVRIVVDLTAVDIRIENVAGGVSATELPEKQASLSYSATSNMLTYSLPVDCATVVMRIIYAKGEQMAMLDNVATHSGVSQIACPSLPGGVYIVHLIVETVDGRTISKTGKIVVC